MRIIDQNKRFSESLLWKLQDNAYLQLGPSSWTEGFVPSYITSNPFIANQYAQVILAYLRDLKRDTVCILDLGAGSGRFGYLCLKALSSENIKIRYVMTDISENTLNYLREHPYLQSFNNLEFAYYRHDEPFQTDEDTPLVLIANYFFDTIPQDLFRISNHQLEEGRVTLSVESENLAADDPKLIPELQAKYNYVPATTEYYKDPILNKILEDYAKTLNDCTFLFPSGGFQALNNFSKRDFLLIAGDQGVSTTAQIECWGEPVIDKHHTFSIAVNYHSLASYFQLKNGVGLLTSMPEPLFATMVGALGTDSLPETTSVFRNTIDAFEPKDYWSLVTEDKNLSLKQILLLLKLGRWDPVNMHAFFDQIRAHLPKASPQEKETLREGIHRTYDQFFLTNKDEGHFIMNLGVLLFEMKQTNEALIFFQRAQDILGPNELIEKNIKACNPSNKTH